jgi:hypothetical protein
MLDYGRMHARFLGIAELVEVPPVAVVVQATARLLRTEPPSSVEPLSRRV